MLTLSVKKFLPPRKTASEILPFLIPLKIGFNDFASFITIEVSIYINVSYCEYISWILLENFFIRIYRQTAKMQTFQTYTVSEWISFGIMSQLNIRHSRLHTEFNSTVFLKMIKYIYISSGIRAQDILYSDTTSRVRQEKNEIMAVRLKIQGVIFKS